MIIVGANIVIITELSLSSTIVLSVFRHFVPDCPKNVNGDCQNIRNRTTKALKGLQTAGDAPLPGRLVLTIGRLVLTIGRLVLTIVFLQPFGLKR